jgi:hypothetical protein
MAEPDDEKTSATAAAAPEPAQSLNERTDRRVLELLVCPVTKTQLAYDETRQELVSRKARLAFPIRHGVPHMIAAEARHLDD